MFEILIALLFAVAGGVDVQTPFGAFVLAVRGAFGDLFTAILGG